MKTRSLDPDIQLLQALADPTRLAIVRQLAGQGEVCACDFGSCCSVRQPTVSHHLRVLREAGVIDGERRGTWIWYRLAPKLADRLGTIALGLVPGGLIPASQRRRTGARPAALGLTPTIGLTPAAGPTPGGVPPSS